MCQDHTRRRRTIPCHAWERSTAATAPTNPSHLCSSPAPSPGHDVNDYEIGKRFDLEIINIMNDDGTLNDKAGPYAGLDRFAGGWACPADGDADGDAAEASAWGGRLSLS